MLVEAAIFYQIHQNSDNFFSFCVYRYEVAGTFTFHYPKFVVFPTICNGSYDFIFGEFKIT